MWASITNFHSKVRILFPATCYLLNPVNHTWALITMLIIRDHSMWVLNFFVSHVITFVILDLKSGTVNFLNANIS